MKNKELIYNCQNNDRKAQAELYQKYKDTLFVLCLKYCRNTKDAEDVLQDSFITIFTKINTYKNSGSFEGWMKRITINKAIDKYHTNKSKPLELIENYNHKVEIEEDISKYSLSTILSFVQKLPDKYRMVFSLYELDNHSHKEISKLLNISIGTSKSNLHRAKKLLQKNLLTYKNNNIKYG